MHANDFESFYKKAGDLYDLEKKILDLSDDFELKIATELLAKFYNGITEIRNAFIETSAITVQLNETDNIDENKIDFMQTILNNDPFEELQKKKEQVFFRVLIEYGDLIKKDEIIKDWIIRASSEMNDEGVILLSTISNLGEFDFNSEDELVYSHLYDWFGPYNYIKDLRNAGTILVKSDKLPDNFSSVIGAIKECYAFQQYLAVTVLCRTALEIALRDLYKKLGFTEKKSPTHAIAYNYFVKIRKDKTKKYNNEYNPSPEDLRNLILRLPEYEEYDEVMRELYSDLSRIIHGSFDGADKKQKSEKFMKETFWLIHDLYNKS